MSQRMLYTAKEVEALLERGGTPADIPADALLPPAARDLLADSKTRSRKTVSQGIPQPAPGPSSDPILPDYVFRWAEGSDPVSPEAVSRFFHSAPIEAVKQKMCDIGDRLWRRNYTDGNGGNLVVRVGDNLFLCTQTLICKGFMTPETISLVDWEGRQLAGKYKRTSEVLTHLAVFRAQPRARATCHAHPPHATAWAVAKVQPPTCMIPEAEVFLGQIGLAEYQTPGTPANAKAVGEVARDHHSILMVNHGVITWGDHIEDAYWKMENTESYCQTLYIAMHLSPRLSTITQGQARELIELRAKLGMADKRGEWKECELCDNSEFQAGVVCQPPAPPAPAAAAIPGGSGGPGFESLVAAITDQIMDRLSGGSSSGADPSTNLNRSAS